MIIVITRQNSHELLVVSYWGVFGYRKRSVLESYSSSEIRLESVVTITRSPEPDALINPIQDGPPRTEPLQLAST